MKQDRFAGCQSALDMSYAPKRCQVAFDITDAPTRCQVACDMAHMLTE